MDRRLKAAFGTIWVLLCGLCISNAAFGQALPDGKGKVEFVHNCTACHTAKLVTSVKKTPDDWKKSVFEMAARGTDGSQEDLDNVVLYLVKNFATDKSDLTAVTAASTATGPTVGTSVLNASAVEGAKRVVNENGCLLCHRVEQQGMYTGPSLNGVGTRRSAEQIRKAIVSPQPTLDPSNNLVRLTTADGTILTGRILSQDDRNVRVIDASGKVATYSKQGLRDFTMIVANPMPSFAGKITGESLDGLVRFLDSLPSLDTLPSADINTQN